MRRWIRYKIKLETKAPFRIGGVKPIPGTSDVDSPVVKLGDKIVVQGTSFKGAFRAELERYLIDCFFDKESNRWSNAWVKPCIPADEKTISHDEKKLVEKEIFKYSCSYPKEKDYICPICYLLGARGLVGYVEVPFLRLVKGSPEILPFIRADRVTGTSAKGEKGALGKFEAMPEGSVFEGTLTILEEDDIIGWRLGEPRDLAGSKGDEWLKSGDWTKERILRELIEERLVNIKKLGGYKSKGFGDVKITLSKEGSDATGKA